MSTSIADELVIEGVSRAFERVLVSQPDLADRLLTRMAELHCELMTPQEAAEMIGVTVPILRANWRDYGLEKSLAFGQNDPRYFRSQVVEAARRKGKLLIAATPRETKVKAELAARITPFPKRSAPTLPTRKEGAG